MYLRSVNVGMYKYVYMRESGLSGIWQLRVRHGRRLRHPKIP